MKVGDLVTFIENRHPQAFGIVTRLDDPYCVWVKWNFLGYKEGRNYIKKLKLLSRPADDETSMWVQWGDK